MRARSVRSWRVSLREVGHRLANCDELLSTLELVTTGAIPADDPTPGTLVVRTVPLDLDAATALVDLLPSEQPVAWVRRGDGVVGWGVAASVHTNGPTRFADADKWWSETAARAVVRDEVAEPGTGLICFGSFGFADEPGDSVLLVPEVVVGRRGDSAWLTTVSVGGLDVPGHPGHRGAARTAPHLPG